MAAKSDGLEDISKNDEHRGSVSNDWIEKYKEDQPKHAKLVNAINIEERVRFGTPIIPVVDPKALETLEKQAIELERSVQKMMDNLIKQMNGISCTSVKYVECYRDCVKNIGNMTDSSTKAMAKLIAKCEEMNNGMEPIYSIVEQIKTIKSLLDQFEELC